MRRTPLMPTSNAFFKTMRNIYFVLKYIPLRRIFLRLRRTYRTQLIIRSTTPFSTTPLTADEALAVTKRICSPLFYSASCRISSLTKSSYEFDGDKGELIFIYSRDRISVRDIGEIDWGRPHLLPASDVNRCYFISFAEFATLLNGDAHTKLEYLHNYVVQLEKAAPLAGSVLSILWQPVSAARRLTNLLAGLSMILVDDSSLSNHASTGFLLEHIRKLSRLLNYLREDDLGYNHEATEIFAQCLYAFAFEDEQALAHRSREFLTSLNRQIEPDGFHAERSATYHAHILGHLDVLIAGSLVTPDSALRSATALAERMRQALATATHPDGTIVLFNDSAIGDGPSPASLNAWPKQIEDGVTLLRHSGIARLQTDPFAVLFDVGPCGPDDNPGHAHADFLSIEMSVNGQRLIIDPGVASYKAGAERNWTRSAATHNGPTFAGAEPIEFMGPFRVGRRGRAYSAAPPPSATGSNHKTVLGWQDGFDYIGGRVARMLSSHSNSTLSISDIWVGAPDFPAQSTFLIPKTWTLLTIGSNQIKFEEQNSATVLFLTAIRGSLSLDEPSPHFPYGPRSGIDARRLRTTPIIRDEARISCLVFHIGSLPDLTTTNIDSSLRDFSDALKQTLRKSSKY